jgi:hypothetical protein
MPVPQPDKLQAALVQAHQAKAKKQARASNDGASTSSAPTTPRSTIHAGTAAAAAAAAGGDGSSEVGMGGGKRYEHLDAEAVAEAAGVLASLQLYDARARVALKRMAHWLRVPWPQMRAFEQMWALQVSKSVDMLIDILLG